MAERSLDNQGHDQPNDLANDRSNSRSRQDWTVALYLSAMTDLPGPRGMVGATDKVKHLEELKEETKGTSVTIVADVLSERGEDPLHPDLEKKTVIGGSYDVTRVVFHNGEEEVISHRPSQGTANNVRDLVQFANGQAPANKVAVVVDFHGSGDWGGAGGVEGALGDTGATPAEIADGLYKATPDAKFDKVDFLDIDGCYGGQLGNLKALSKSARQVVASETLERAFTQSDSNKVDNGQDLNSWLSKLLSQPQMDGNALANTVVDQANKKANATISDATPTLSHYDLENGLPKLEQALNKAGSALADAMKNKNSRVVINSVIDHLPNVAIEVDGSVFDGPMSKRDLGEFVHALELRIKSGELKDQSGKLKTTLSTVDDALSDRNGLITANHFAGSKPSPVDPNHLRLPQMHGLSVYLPDSQASKGKVSDYQLRFLYQLEAGTQASGWKNFLQSIVHVDE